jgi:hypothetical protein
MTLLRSEQSGIGEPLEPAMKKFNRFAGESSRETFPPVPDQHLPRGHDAIDDLRSTTRREPTRTMNGANGGIISGTQLIPGVSAGIDRFSRRS